jgi:hypothetical protein
MFAGDELTFARINGLPPISLNKIRLLLFIVLTLSSFSFIGAGHDDAWIMLFAGETLGKGSWFLNHNDVAQEISTSVLGAILAAIASALASSGFEFALWKIFAWLPAMAAGMVLFEILSTVCGRRYGVYGVLALCCFPQWHYWAWGGLESGLFWLVTLLFLYRLASFSSVLSNQAALASAFFAALLPLVRADALWAPALLLGSGIFFRNVSIWNRFWPGLLACASVFAFHCLRYHFTDQWLPNPAYAKAPFSFDSLRYGFEYLYQFHSDSPAHSLLVLAVPISLFGIFKLFRSDAESTCFQVRLFAWVCAIVLTIDLTTLVAGGDWMGYHRFAVRSLPMKVLVIALWINDMAKSGVFSKVRRSLQKLSGLTLCLLIFSGWTAEGIVERLGYYRNASSISNERLGNTWQGLSNLIMKSNIPTLRDHAALLTWIIQTLPTLVDAMQRQAKKPLIIASYQAGFFPRELRKRYTTNELFFIDLAGLSDSRVGRLPGAKTPFGLSDGVFNWAQTLAKGQGPLGNFLSDCRPDIVYVLHAKPEEIQQMREAKFEISYSKFIEINGLFHGAVIFKSLIPGDKRCSGLM